MIDIKTVAEAFYYANPRDKAAFFNIAGRFYDKENGLSKINNMYDHLDSWGHGFLEALAEEAEVNQ